MDVERKEGMGNEWENEVELKVSEGATNAFEATHYPCMCGEYAATAVAHLAHCCALWVHYLVAGHERTNVVVEYRRLVRRHHAVQTQHEEEYGEAAARELEWAVPPL